MRRIIRVFIALLHYSLFTSILSYTLKAKNCLNSLFTLKSSIIDINYIETCLRDSDRMYPFINPEIINHLDNTIDQSMIIEIDPNVVIENDVISLNGIEEYKKSIAVWKSNTINELTESNFSIKKIYRDDNRVILYWNMSFIPDSLTSMVSIGRSIPFWRVTFFDLLDKANQKSTFSWASFWLFFQRLFLTGEMKLPHAVIEGETEFKFVNVNSQAEETLELTRNENYNAELLKISDDKRQYLSKTWRLVSCKESLNLVRLLKRNYLKNRKLATDLLEYLDTKRPENFGLNHWNDELIEKIPFQTVPGMRQFDIDGLEATEQQQLLSQSSQLLGYATGFILLFGIGVGSVVMDRIFVHYDQVKLQEKIDKVYNQFGVPVSVKYSKLNNENKSKDQNKIHNYFDSDDLDEVYQDENI